MHKVTRVRIYAILMLGILLHITILERIRVFNSRPDIIFALVIFFGLFCGTRMGLEAGLIGGVFKDLFTADPFGLTVIVFGASGFLASRISPKVYIESKLTQFLLVSSFHLLAASAHFALKFATIGSSTLLRDWTPSYWEFFGSSLVPATLYTSTVSLPLFGSLIKFFGLEEPSLI